MSNTDEKTARDIKRLIAAARALKPYLSASDDIRVAYIAPVQGRDVPYKTKGQQLREDAERADEKDEAIKKFRIALAQFEE